MPVEATTDSSENRCPVRRSGRQPKRTDKLEEFLMTAKRGSRKSAPPSVESGDPPSQTPTDAETASEASFDGNADSKMAEDKAESPERRTRSSAKKLVQNKTQGGRQTRSAGRATVKEEGSSENEEDNKEDKKAQTQDKSEEIRDTKPVPVSKDVGSAKAAEDSEEVVPEETKEPETHTGETEKETDEEDADKPAVMTRKPVRTYINKKKMAKKSPTPIKAPTPFSRNTAPTKNETKPKAAGKMSKNETTEEEEDDDESFTSSSSSSDESDNGGYDPNALYCICRQKHNKRFMICCDRCEEWFHGDCVGITEARGRLMERNGEDYICPNCTAKKNQVVRPATSILPTSAETTKPRADVASQVMAAAAASASAERVPAGGAGLNLSAGQAVAPPTPSTASGAEEKAVEDQGIKGRIEKATNPSGKKRIKIFQPQAIHQPVEPEANQKVVSAGHPKVPSAAEQKAPPEPEQRVETIVEVNTTPAVEVPEEKAKQKAEDDSSLPKCIGPGCDSIAQPDSVYCGNDCILKHAAAAMKSITDVKEPKQKDKTKPQKNKSTAKKGGAGGKAQKKTQRVSDCDEDFSSDPDEDDEDEHAEEHPPPPSTASWSSDHNYIAVTPEKTPPISPTVLNKKSPPKEEKKTEKEQNPSPEKSTKASAALRKGKKKSPSQKSAAVLSKSKKSSSQAGSSKVSKKPATAPTKTAEKSKKPGQASAPAPSPFPAGPIHVTGALRVTKSNFTIPKKQPQQKDSTSQSQPDSSSRVPSSTPSSHSSSRPSHPPVSTSHTSPVRPPANNQMRQNIRRSLTDILFKRVTDSDDLKMTEGDVGRLAYAIEKEMFNLCLSTDSKYKNKYRTLMFNLKDPKNKGLFYRVIGRQITPFRLVRLSAEELLSKEISEWRKPESSEGHSRAHSGHSRHGSRHESGSHSVDVEDVPPSDADDHDEAGSTPSASAQSSAEGNSGGNMVDVFSSMLKDTTSEHKTHLFDLNCKICTGQKAEDEPASKKARLSSKPDIKSPRQDSRSSRSGDPPSVNPAAYPPLDPLTSHQPVPPSYHSNTGPVVPETPPQLYQEDPNVMAPPTPTPTLISPAVSSVSISRRDPRMARLSSAAIVAPPALDKPTSTTADPVPAPVTVPVAAPIDAGVKVPLPMPPAPTSAVAVPKSSKKSSAEPPPEGETAIFLYGQETIWKGFVNMQAVAKFVTKAYLVSGSFEHLKEDLPDTIHIGGRISPSTVWDYVGKLKTSLSKELCLIRFQPATEEEEVAYVSLFSYFSSRKRFGVVANNNRRIKDLYLIPLGSKDPLPSKLLPFDGPGLEPARPNLLLGLLICQKDRKRAGAPLETEEKRSKTQTKDADETGLPKPATAVKADRSARQSLEIPFSTTPPGSPPSSSSETSSSSSSTTTSTAVSVLSLLSAVKTPVTSATPGKDSTSRSSSAAASVSPATPLQTILNTIFRNKKQDSDASNSPPDQTGELPATASMLDPIVQQFTQNPKEKPVEEDEDDRPYDPEEEYDPSRVFNVTKKPADELIKPEVSKQPEVVAAETDDVEYDPEDDSIFDDVKTLIPAQGKPVAENLPDAKKILENLRRIGDQALQKQAEQQTSSTETAAAALVLPNTLPNSHLLQLGKKVEELVKSSSVSPLINQRRDPRQSRDPRQAVAEQKLSEPEQKEELSPPLTEPSPSAPLAQEQLQPKVEEHADTSQGPETSPPQEEVKSETLPFMDSESEGVSIPLLGEELEPDMEVNYMNDRKKKNEEADKAETKGDKYSIWPNAASILKAGEDSEYEETSQDAPSSRYHRESSDSSTVTSTIPVLTQSTVADAHLRHMSHHMSAAGFGNEYRPTADIPPQSSFLSPHSLQGQNLMLRPPPSSMLPPMQGPPPMSGPSSIQGHPPTIHVPPPVHARPPCQGDGNQQYGPPMPSYPPYQNQNQWPNTQPQQQPPPGPPLQNVLPPRGPPLSFPPVSQRAPPPQIFDPSINPQHIGLQGPPPNFEGQNSLPPPRFTSPPPPFNFPANRGPPPPFTGPPPSAHFDNRLPPPALFPSPRAPPPSQHYSKDTPSNSFNPRMDQNPNPPHYFKESLGPPAPPAYRGPSPDHYEDRRGLPPSGELSGPLFKPPNQYGSSRPPPSSPLERRSFDEPRGPPAQENRSHLSQISERYRFDWHSDEPRPVRHGMPLLSHPADRPHGPPSRHGAQSPDLQREDHWRHLSPEMRRRSSIAHEDLEPRSGERGERLSRFEVPHRELGSGSSQSLEERQRELPEDRRREREKESPHGGRPSWDRGMGKRWSRAQDWDRGRERERDPERGREGDRSRGRESEKNRDAEGERQREQDSEKRRERDKEREKEKEKEKERDRDKDRDRPRESDRRDYDRDRARIRDRDRERDRRRDRSRSRDRDRDRGKDRGKDREREKERERDRDRERERDRDRNRDQEKRSKEKKEDKKDSKRDTSKEKTKSADSDKYTS